MMSELKSLRAQRSASILSRPLAQTSCQQCEQHVQVINLWKRAVRSIAKEFLSVHKEIIRAESFAKRMMDTFVDFKSDRTRPDADHDSRASTRATTRRKGRSECTTLDEDPSELISGLISALSLASNLCRKGAFDCFESKDRTHSSGGPTRETEHVEKFTGTSKRHSFSEVILATDKRKAPPLKELGKPQSVCVSDMPHPSSPQLGARGSGRPDSVNERTGSASSSESSSDLDHHDHDYIHILGRLKKMGEERDRLLGEIEKQRLDNLKARQSLAHTWSNLEHQNIQLAMALQDLSVATTEIKKASSLQTQLNQLELEKQDLLDKLESLEDESSCVKLSLVHILQEKSAYIKHLELENSRLVEALQQDRAVSPGRDSNSSEGKSPSGDDVGEDLTSVRSPSVTEEDVLAAIGDITDIPVHKQGFMVKEGGRVKTWKKRLFVLNSIGLYYYKTDNPAGCIRINSMKKVEHCKNRNNTFRICTPHRKYLCMAPNQEEMQSWIGMLESLRQHKFLGELAKSPSTSTLKSAENPTPIPLPVKTVDIPRTRTKRSPQIDRHSMPGRRTTALEVSRLTTSFEISGSEKTHLEEAGEPSNGPQ